MNTTPLGEIMIKGAKGVKIKSHFPRIANDTVIFTLAYHL
jgi:hypothetical protein